MSALLSCRDVVKEYGSLRALDGVSLSIDPGEVRGLIGPNGSGKSTLMRMISGAEAPTAGSVELGGRRIERLAPERRNRLGVAIKFQLASVFPTLTVLENVLLAQSPDVGVTGWLRGRLQAERQAAEAIIEAIGLVGRRDAVASTLSHGEQQWLEIAMALGQQPRLLLLDEPTAGMSSEERARTEEILRSSIGPAAVLIVEHDIDFVRRLADSITVLHQGRVVGEGTPQEIGEPCGSVGPTWEVIGEHHGDRSPRGLRRRSGADRRDPHRPRARRRRRPRSERRRQDDAHARPHGTAEALRGHLHGTGPPGRRADRRADSPGRPGLHAPGGRRLQLLDRRREPHPGRARTLITRALQTFPALSDRQHQRAGTLSGGERKMLGVAGVQVWDAPVWILDEPSEGVWSAVVDDMADLLADAKRERAIVLVEQNLPMALSVADYVYVLGAGTVQLEGDPDALRDDPRLTELLTV